MYASTQNDGGAPRPASHLRSRFGESRSSPLALLLLVYLLLGVAFSLVTPPFEAPDEPFHYAFVRHIAQGNGLPVQDEVATGPWAQEGSQAPLYYLVAGLLTAGIDAGDFPELTTVNPARQHRRPALAGQQEFHASQRPAQAADADQPGRARGALVLAAVGCGDDPVHLLHRAIRLSPSAAPCR
jgi:hypothetical protein